MKLSVVLSEKKSNYSKQLTQLKQCKKDLETIPVFDPDDGTLDPFWFNGMFPGLDASALLMMLRYAKPARYVEIGSGHSTRFARWAIERWNLPTHITAIDSSPGMDVTSISNETLRLPVQQIDISVFERLAKNDIVFFDGSHIAKMGSDVVHFFNVILPKLKSGVLVQIHDIFLPDDYPPVFGHERGYNEQYLLAAFLTGGRNRVDVLWPSAHLSRLDWAQKEFTKIFGRIKPQATRDNQVQGFQPWGGSFWFQIKTREKNVRRMNAKSRVQKKK